jgi:cell division protein ZapA
MKEEGKKQAVEITVMGQRFLIASNHDAEYVRKIAAYVEQKIKEVESKSGSVSTLKIAIYAALNIAGEYFTLAQQQKENLNNLIEKSERIVSFLDERIGDDDDDSI